MVNHHLIYRRGRSHRYPRAEEASSGADVGRLLREAAGT
jgi:hypothetical protein